MKIITISREFGSGGRELGKRLADVLGFDYYDREIITAIAEKQQLDENYVETSLNNYSWKNFTLQFHRSFATVPNIQVGNTGLFLEQKRVIEEIAKRGRDCVIVGRNADVILEDFKPCNIFVCADTDSKVLRCMERAQTKEKLTRRTVIQNMKRIDKNRATTREIITGSRWGERGAYHLTVNTTGWQIKELTEAVAEYTKRWFDKTTA